MKSSKTRKQISIAPIDQLETIEDRFKLREYCKQNSIVTPDYFASDEFSKISQWAMKKNTFPLCLKSAHNLSHNHLIYILKAFRELPEFFESIQAKTNNGKVLIEEFIEGKAYLEVTFLNNQIRLISQISLSKTMKLQQKWRAFPVKLPQNILEKIEAIVKHFDKLIESAKEPIRFSFVVKNAEPILLSINSDNERLEYMDDWRVQGGLEPLNSAKYPPTTSAINKINIYNSIKDHNLDFSSSVKVCSNSKVKYELIKNKLYFMITSSSPKLLAEDFEKANAVIKQIIDSGNQ